MPQLAAANQALAAELAHRSAQEFDVEHLSDGEEGEEGEGEEGPHVSMELACGVIDLRTEEAAAAVEHALAAAHGAAVLQCDGSDSESETESESEDEPPAQQRDADQPPAGRLGKHTRIQEMK